MNSTVRKFIDDLEIIDESKAAIVKSLYKLFFDLSSELDEKFIYGGIGIYAGNRLIGGVYVSKQHVSLIFSKGNELVDKYKVLLGTGKWRRQIVLIHFEDILQKHCSYYIEQVIEIEKESR